jgi:hypothetical protein
MYINNRQIYDSIRDIVYIVRDRNDPEGGYCWVKESVLGQVLKEHDVDLLAKQLIVRLRLPWVDLVPTDWLVSQEELDKNREYYDVLDVVLRVKHKDVDGIMPLFNMAEFEKNRDNYEIIEAQYLVSLKLTKKNKAELLGIDPDTIHTYMSE